jgi:pimeloyl-ACP methyl ester carboxylesterase
LSLTSTREGINVSALVKVNGARLWLEVAGVGEAVVFVHGFSLDARMWDAQFEVFARRCRAVRFDARGFGRSSLPDEPSGHADDLRTILDHLEIKGATIVGLSMGGRPRSLQRDRARVPRVSASGGVNTRVRHGRF